MTCNTCEQHTHILDIFTDFIASYVPDADDPPEGLSMEGLGVIGLLMHSFGNYQKMIVAAETGMPAANRVLMLRELYADSTDASTLLILAFGMGWEAGKDRESFSGAFAEAFLSEGLTVAEVLDFMRLEFIPHITYS